MAAIVAFVSQKGGVGKSTLSRALAREVAIGGLRVKIADLDTQQGTSVDWHRLRLSQGIEPTVSVEAFSTAAFTTVPDTSDSISLKSFMASMMQTV